MPTFAPTGFSPWVAFKLLFNIRVLGRSNVRRTTPWEFPKMSTALYMCCGLLVFCNELRSIALIHTF